ncbi:hypothetical protein CRG98_004546 [Punica granatum]|uniref:Uncharacterized protein n=1 Tax=Punica granatum TaxID=22663 RepID=A0A2I0L303_PUNGR|nr:hypothetical protein CRG98_004546 [Punica granatum]
MRIIVVELLQLNEMESGNWKAGQFRLTFRIGIAERPELARRLGVFLPSSHLIHDQLGQSILPTLDHGADFRPKSLGKAVDQLLILIRGLRRWDATCCA